MKTDLYRRITSRLLIAKAAPVECCGGPACGMTDPIEEFESDQHVVPAHDEFRFNELCREVERIAAAYEARIAALEETIAAMREGRARAKPLVLLPLA